MLKRFFVSLLGTVAGIWISFILLFFGLIIVMAIAGSSESDSGIKDHSILYIDLTGAIEERAETPTMSDVLRGNVNTAPTLRELQDALAKAADDKRIDGLVLNCGGAMMGFATAQELGESLAKFKEESGKWIYAYADGYEQTEYMLSTYADSVFVNPLGSVNLHGIASQIPFFKGLMDKVGVKMQIVKVGTFKSAVEPFILTSASEPSRLQTQTFIDSIWDSMSGVISANRNISAERVHELASVFMVARGAEEAKSAGLVDALIYRRVFENRLRELTERDADEDLRLVSPQEMAAEGNAEAEFSAILETAMKQSKGNKDKKKADKPVHGEHLAVLYATGDITDNSGNGIVGSEMVPEITALADDDDVLGLVLRVNSGGGSAFASEQIWEALEYFKSKGKPFYVSMGDYAASGGYYISCGAETIFADATTLTGSIGVFGMIPDASGLISGKLGINFSTIESNPNAVMPSYISPLTPEQYSALQSSVEQTYDLFTKRVAAGRGMTQDDVKAIAEGRVWVGSQAIGLGLVDTLGSLDDCIEAIKDKIGDSELKTVFYPESTDDFWTMIARSGALNGAKAALADPRDLALDEETAEMLRYVARLRSLNPVQARMELFFMK